MKEIYICSTYYHLLIAIEKALLTKGDKPELMVTNHIADGKNLTLRIQEKGIFHKVWYSGEVKEYECKNSLERLLFLHSRNASCIRKQLPMDIGSYEKVNIFHDDTWVSHYLQDIKKPYYLLEDALDSYVIILDTVWAYMVEHNLFKDLIKNVFRYGYQYAGDSPYTISVEVNQKKDVKIRKKEKLIEVPREILKKQLSEDQMRLIAEIFEVELPEENLDVKKILLLTQPISVDKVVNGVSEQIAVYKQIVEKQVELQNDDWMLYIKPHPRDDVDYKDVFPQAVICKKEMPVEMFDYIGNMKFQIGVSLFSTSLRGLCCVEEKRTYHLDKETVHEENVE